MKLSAKTLQVLKNFSSIQGNILLLEGSTQKTIASGSNVVATAVLEDKFPVEFGIYDVNEFLGILSLFTAPDLNFKGVTVTISEGKNSIEYRAAEKTVLKYPKKDLPDTEWIVDFKVSSTHLQSIIKTASVLGVPDVSIVADGKKFIAKVHDKENTSSNVFVIDLEQKTSETFTANVKVETLKMLPTDYTASVSKRMIKWENSDSSLVYIVAVEQDSKF